MKISSLEALELISRLPDDVPLTTEEAAVFLRLSVTTLERMRADGTGPVYSQGGAKGAGGTNQKCLYLKADLKVWLAANRVSSSMEAAVRKGQMFRTLGDVQREVAVWIGADGLVAGLVEDTEVDVFFGRLGNPLWGVEWVSAMEAAMRPWSDIAAHKEFAGNVSECLRGLVDAVSAAVDASEMTMSVDG